MGAHLNAYSTREHTAYYIKALSKDLPKGNACGGDGRDGIAVQGCKSQVPKSPWHGRRVRLPLERGLAVGNRGCQAWRFVPFLLSGGPPGTHTCPCIQLWSSWRT